MITVALITPTIGRVTLKRTMESVLPQLGPKDEWWIVGDGPQLSARQLVREMADPRIRYREHRNSRSRYGDSQRNLAMRMATADYFVFVDDDDYLLPGALDAVRREGETGLPLMFRMDYHPRGMILWEHPVLKMGNVGGANFVVPNIQGKFSEWPQVDQMDISDFHFITRTLALWPPESLKWCEDVIYCSPVKSNGAGSPAPSAQGKSIGRFDEWRARRNQVSYKGHVDFYDAVFRDYPYQHYCQVEEARQFARQLPMGTVVLEIGGWKGEVAAALLDYCPAIVRWYNFELSTKAVRAGLEHPHYFADVADDFLWKLDTIPSAFAFFAAHVLEHLCADEIECLLSRLSLIENAYVESPLPESGTANNWNGTETTNVLEIGWRELEALFQKYGLEVCYRKGNVRWFRRRESQSGSYALPTNLIGANTVIHPTANIYRSQIGAGTKIAAFTEVGGAKIGDRCKIQAHVFIPPGVTVGDEVFIGPGVLFTNDRYPKSYGEWTIVPTFIERGASIGAGSVILPGVTIGAGAQVGAGSIVTSDVVAGDCVVGNPARPMLNAARKTIGNNCLIILQPREIPEAISSLRALPIDKAWFRGFTEEALVPHVNHFINETHYSNYLLCADDVTVTRGAFDSVLKLLSIHPTATGYCQLAAGHPKVNITRAPVTLSNGQSASWNDYDFYDYNEVQEFTREFVSWFGGWALSGMRRELWQKYPFEVNQSTRRQSDFQTALRMGLDGLGFYCHRDAYITHLKQDVNHDYRAHWLVDKVEPTIALEFASNAEIAVS